MTTTTAQTALPTSPRVAALGRAVVLREATVRLARDHSGIAPGLVLAVTARCARDLHRAGCTDEHYPEALDRLVRAVLMARLA